LDLGPATNENENTRRPPAAMEHWPVDFSWLKCSLSRESCGEVRLKALAVSERLTKTDSRQIPRSAASPIPCWPPPAPWADGHRLSSFSSFGARRRSLAAAMTTGGRCPRSPNRKLDMALRARCSGVAYFPRPLHQKRSKRSSIRAHAQAGWSGNATHPASFSPSEQR
jgi:hypothetical protein